MSDLLEVRALTVELPAPAGWVRPVNEVSLNIAAGESLGQMVFQDPFASLNPPHARQRNRWRAARHS